MMDRATALAPGGVTGLSPVGVDLPLARSGDPGWLLVEEGFSLVREHEIELIFVVANGYIGTRASLEEGSQLSKPATFAAGVYADDPASELGPALVVLPDWPHIEIAVDGARLSMELGRVRGSANARSPPGRTLARVASARLEWVGSLGFASFVSHHWPIDTRSCSRWR